MPSLSLTSAVKYQDKVPSIHAHNNIYMLLPFLFYFLGDLDLGAICSCILEVGCQSFA